MVRNSGVDLKFKGRVKWRIVQGTIKNHNTIIIQLHIYFYFHNLFRENCKNCFTRKKGCIKNTLVFHYEVFLFKNKQKNSLQNRTAIAESKRKFFNMANVSLNTANTTCHLIYQSITSPTTYIYACIYSSSVESLQLLVIHLLLSSYGNHKCERKLTRYLDLLLSQMPWLDIFYSLTQHIWCSRQSP